MLNHDQILDLIHGGGSGEFGIHTYLKIAECPQFVRQWDEVKKYKQEPLVIKRDAGSIFHALRKEYHEQIEFTIPREDPDGSAELSEILAEGWRMFDFYKTYMPVGHVGTVQGQELHLESKTPNGHFFAGQIDVLVNIEAGTAIPGLQEGPITRSGLYVWDDKTHPGDSKGSGRTPSSPFSDAAASMQFVGYSWLLEQNGYGTPQGTLVHHIVGHKPTRTNPEGMSLERSVLTVLLPPPMPVDYNRLFNFIAYAHTLKTMRQTEPNSGYNLSACAGKYQPCPFLLDGRCSRGA